MKLILFPVNICWSWIPLQYVFSVTIFQFPKPFENIFQICLANTSCYAEDVLKTSWRHVLKTSWRYILKMSWRRYGDKQNVYWGYLYLTNLNVYLTNLYFTNLYLTILRRIQNALIRIQQFHYSLFWNSSSISILRIKISDECSVLWNQLNSNSPLQNRWGYKHEFLSNILHKHF